MISLLSSFKPFCGHTARSQENCLRNWRSLGQDVEIIIYGEGEGVAEYAAKFGAMHVPDIECSQKGIPRFDKIAEHAAKHAKYDTQTYLNGDILLPSNLIKCLTKVNIDPYLIVGQRIDLAQNSSLRPEAPDWLAEITRCYDSGELTLASPSYADYFIFPRDLWKELKPLVIGRGGYDNALLAFCLRHRIPIINATRCLHVVHQWHNYGHVAGTFNEAYFGEDAMANRRIHDIAHSPPNLEDADWELLHDKIAQIGFLRTPLRRIEVMLRYRYGWKYPSYLLRAVSRLAWRTGCKPLPLELSDVLRTKSLQT